MPSVLEAVAAIAALDDPAALVTVLDPPRSRRSADGPLAGVPIVVKDNIAVPGVPTSAGSPLLADRPEPVGAAVERLLDAGASIVATASLHELAFGITGRNDWTGMPTNPIAPERVPGGSSSGSAVAVARGVVDVALGTDTGGSARIPAACCGIAGFRPTTGRYPSDGLVLLSPTRDTIGVLGRTVDDVRAVDAVLGGAAGDLAPGTLRRIAVLDDAGVARCDAAVSAAYRSWIEGRRERGIEIVEVDVSSLLDANDRASFAVALRETVLEFSVRAEAMGITFDELVGRIAGADVRALLSGETPTEAEHRDAIEVVLPEMRAWYDAVYDRADLFAWPTLPVLPPRRHELDHMEVDGELRPTFPTVAAFTSPASLAGVPSLSVPLQVGPEPVGLMLEAPAGADGALLGLADAARG